MKTDSQLQKDVMNELKWQPSIKSSEIGVSVSDGIVTLYGSVDNYAEKREAERAALRVEGVKGVAEDIVVDLPLGNKKDNSDIAKAAINALKWDTMVPDDHIKVRVDNGWVTTEGKVDWLYQKAAVSNALSNLTGVKGVTNLVTIIPKTNSEDIKKKITAAFERSATIDANNIQVEKIGDKVLLKGFVRSYAERIDAQHAASNAPGVAEVENRLEVKVPSYDEA